MVRKNANGAVAGEQLDLIPELGDSPEHKDLLRRAKLYANGVTNRDELLKTNKAEVDGLMQKVIEQMHNCGLTKFKHEGFSVELVAGKEKVKLKIEAGEDEEPTDDE